MGAHVEEQVFGSQAVDLNSEEDASGWARPLFAVGFDADEIYRRVL
jgi:hypothetical protein